MARVVRPLVAQLRARAIDGVINSATTLVIQFTILWSLWWIWKLRKRAVVVYLGLLVFQGLLGLTMPSMTPRGFLLFLALRLPPVIVAAFYFRRFV